MILRPLYPASFFQNGMVEGELFVQLQVHLQEDVLADEPVMLPTVPLVMDPHPGGRVLYKVSSLRTT